MLAPPAPVMRMLRRGLVGMVVVLSGMVGNVSLRNVAVVCGAVISRAVSLLELLYKYHQKILAIKNRVRGSDYRCIMIIQKRLI